MPIKLSDTAESVRKLLESSYFDSDVAYAIAQDCDIAYGEEGRHYHDLRHLYEVVSDLLLSGECDHAGGIELIIAGAYHDFICDPRADKGDNECASAKWARKRAESWGYDGREVTRLIMLTIDHKVHDEDDFTGKALCDADLARFAAPWPDFVRNNEDIRKEYSHVSNDDWLVGRPAVLEHYLYRDPFYYSLYGEEEATRATLNIVRALRELKNK